MSDSEEDYSFLYSDSDEFKTDDDEYDFSDDDIEPLPPPVTSNLIKSSSRDTYKCGEKPIVYRPSISGSLSFTSEDSGDSGDVDIAQGLSGEQRAYGIEEVYKKSRLGKAGDLSMSTYTEDSKISSLMMRALKKNPREFNNYRLLDILQSSELSKYLNNRDKEIIYKYLFLFTPTEKHYRYFNVTLYTLGYVLNKNRKPDGSISLELLEELDEKYIRDINVTKLNMNRYSEMVRAILA